MGKPSAMASSASRLYMIEANSEGILSNDWELRSADRILLKMATQKSPRQAATVGLISLPPASSNASGRQRTQTVQSSGLSVKPSPKTPTTPQNSQHALTRLRVSRLRVGKDAIWYELDSRIIGADFVGMYCVKVADFEE